MRLAVSALILLPGHLAGAMELRDVHFGEALYYAHQERYFDALQRLDAELVQHYAVDEPQLDSLHPHIHQAEFSVGDFELNYRMHQRAGRAIKAVLEADVDEAVRNDAAFRLARIHFQKGQPYDALRALEGMDGPIPEGIRDDVEFLRANVYMAVGRSADAVDVLDELGDSEDLRGFSGYNRGIALLQSGELRDAIEQLDRAGRVRAGDPATLAIRDKANLVVGTLLFETSEFERAEASLGRVRLSGPFSNRALLRAGWADVSAGNFERATVPWKLLVDRESTDAAVQEAMLALPYAYNQLALYGRAALMYGKAVETFGAELARVDASIRSVDTGKFLEALGREEIHQDKDWVIHLRSLPDAPETFYLTQLIASHEFQTGLQNYLDLEDMRKRLEAWTTSLDAFEDVVRLRREYYEPRLGEIDAAFRSLDSQVRLRLEQREHLNERLQHMLIAPRPDYLATSGEREAEAELDRLRAALGDVDEPRNAAMLERIRRLRGVLTWNVETRYHARLTETYRHLLELNRDVDVLQARYDAFLRTRQAATHSYEGYGDAIASLRSRVERGLERLEVLQEQQGRLLETVASEELGRRRARLETYLNQARFAFADSYDRASKAQSQQ